MFRPEVGSVHSLAVTLLMTTPAQQRGLVQFMAVLEANDIYLSPSLSQQIGSQGEM